MLSMRGKNRAYPFLTMAALLAVTGCLSLEDPASEEGPEAAEESDESPSPVDAEGETGQEAYDDEELASQRPDGAVTHTETFVSNDGQDVLDLSVTIDPIVREHVEQHDDENDFLQVSMRFEAESENEDYGWLVGEMLHNPAIGGTVDEVRLIDAENLLAHQPVQAHDGEDWLDISRMSNQGLAAPGGDEVLWRGFFNTVDETSDELSVLIPYMGVVADVPVISAEEAEEDTWASLADVAQDDWDLLRQIWDLEIYRENMFDGYGSRYDGEETTLTVSGDLLFEFGEAELTDEAAEALEGASDEFEEIEGGELQIIGHTDDVSDEEFMEEAEGGLPETDGPVGEVGETMEVTHSDGRSAGVTVESVEQGATCWSDASAWPRRSSTLTTTSPGR